MARMWAMTPQITPKERAELAEKLEVHEQYIYQCMTGRRDMDPLKATDLERVSDGRIRRWQVHKNWHRIWPELVGTDGAPEPQAAEA